MPAPGKFYLDNYRWPAEEMMRKRGSRMLDRCVAVVEGTGEIVSIAAKVMEWSD